MPKNLIAVTFIAALMSTAAPQAFATEKYGTNAQHNSGQYGSDYHSDAHNRPMNTSDYNRVAPAANDPDYRGDSSNRPAMDRGYEAERSNNIENHVTHRTQPYHKDMSMNDYNKRLKTAFRGQTAIQPERGFND